MNMVSLVRKLWEQPELPPPVAGTADFVPDLATQCKDRDGFDVERLIPAFRRDDHLTVREAQLFRGWFLIMGEDQHVLIVHRTTGDAIFNPMYRQVIDYIRAWSIFVDQTRRVGAIAARDWGVEVPGVPEKL